MRTEVARRSAALSFSPVYGFLDNMNGRLFPGEVKFQEVIFNAGVDKVTDAGTNQEFHALLGGRAEF